MNKKTLNIKLINALAYIAPYFSARLSYRLWTSTHRHAMPLKEKAVFNAAARSVIRVDGFHIMTYAWQVEQNRPLVLLLHGWDGRATQLQAFITMLTDEGYGVISFDAHGHGLSDGNNTNIMESVAIIKKLSVIYGDFFAMIGHSFGAMAAVNAINQGVVCEKFIGVSSPTAFAALLSAFADYLKINKRAEKALAQLVFKKYKISSFEQISITGLAPQMCIPSLFIHDEDDDKVPLSQAQKAVALWGRDADCVGVGRTESELNEAGAKLHITKGLGHVRILRKPLVLAASLRFLKGLF